MKLDNRIAVVTGSGKNLGKEIALAMAEEGADIVIHVNNSVEEGEEVVKQIKSMGRRSMLVQGDITDSEQVTSIFKEVRTDIKRDVDILVNNVAIRPKQGILEITPEDWDRVLGTNLKAPFFCIQQVLKGMIKQKYGRIINISGADAITGLANRAHNITAKEGLIGLTKAVAQDVRELAGNNLVNVTSNAVLPGVMDTERIRDNYPNWDSVHSQLENYPIPRLGVRREIAKTCVFIASEDAGYMTGQSITVDGGATIQPFFRA